MVHLGTFITLTHGRISKIGQDRIFFKALNILNLESYFGKPKLRVINNSKEKRGVVTPTQLLVLKISISPSTMGDSVLIKNSPQIE